MQTRTICELNELELTTVSAGTVAPIARAFYWGGVVQTIIWVSDAAYEAGKWVGRNS